VLTTLTLDVKLGYKTRSCRTGHIRILDGCGAFDWFERLCYVHSRWAFIYKVSVPFYLGILEGKIQWVIAPTVFLCAELQPGSSSLWVIAPTVFLCPELQPGTSSLWVIAPTVFLCTELQPGTSSLRISLNRIKQNNNVAALVQTAQWPTDMFVVSNLFSLLSICVFHSLYNVHFNVRKVHWAEGTE
jgi:hypothetical protein